MRLGTCSDGRDLSYDEVAYEFSIGGCGVGLDEVVALDDAGCVQWRALEQRDWMRRIDAETFARCHEQASTPVDLDALSPEQRVIADAARDDGILAGKLVDADPALVQAVADELVKRGLAGTSARATVHGDDSEAGAPPRNPLADRELPLGMEALSQMERARGVGRSMTRAERRLMKRILKQDDKAKARQERQAARVRSTQRAAQSAEGAASDGGQ